MGRGGYLTLSASNVTVGEVVVELQEFFCAEDLGCSWWDSSVVQDPGFSFVD